ncbi:abnormal spindle-like microcephaly-associated protein homolog isoform X1 [Liolophura sinensis]|uniref:abnormal spindle-like microcephaly-associated protein homolog isoform X1 n=1 Tax=Liolophura sinensis TaxID=3198878 RepID=UPI0031593608
MAVPFSNTKLRVPKGFQNILEGLAREILRSQPNDLFDFGAVYFENLLKVREETGHDPAVHGAKLEDRFYNNESFKNLSSDTRQPTPPQSETTQGQKTTEEEEIDIDLDDPEVADAAMKIQAGFRGFKARKEVQSKVEAKTGKQPESKPEASTKQTDLDPELADIDLDDPELSKAATKIQAGFRGHAARKQLPAKSTEVEKKSEGEVKTEGDNKEEEIDIDLNDPEVAQAATKIQASFRGHKARQEIKHQVEKKSEGEIKIESDNKEEEIDIDLNDPEVAQAATKIQASFRGHKVRQEIKQQEVEKKSEGEIKTEGDNKEEEIDIDLNDPEVAQAATKIQASFRGHKARQEIKQQVEKKPEGEIKQDESKEEEIDIDLNDPDVSQAATKIQASFRGHKVRQEIKQQQVEKKSEGEIKTESDNKEAEIDIDLNDPEVAQAATKIQASFRGHKVRQEIKQKQVVGENSEGEVKTEGDDKEEEIDIDLNDPEVEEAATKIQASFRGHKARQEIKQKQAEMKAADNEGVKTGEVTAKPDKGSKVPAAEEEEVDIDLNDPEVATAALRIQANFKGFKTRKALRNKKDDAPADAPSDAPAQGEASTEPPAEKAAEEEIDIDLEDPETEKAALKIQAGFRGYKSRKEIKNDGDQSGESKAGETEETPGEEKPTAATEESKAGGEEIDIDLEDPEVSAAASKIQATFRGHKTRKDLKNSPSYSGESGEKPEEDKSKEEPSESGQDPAAES